MLADPFVGHSLLFGFVSRQGQSSFYCTGLHGLLHTYLVLHYNGYRSWFCIRLSFHVFAPFFKTTRNKFVCCFLLQTLRIGVLVQMKFYINRVVKVLYTYSYFLVCRDHHLTYRLLYLLLFFHISLFLCIWLKG